MEPEDRRTTPAFVNVIAFLLIGIFSVVAIAAPAAPAKKPAPAASGRPLSKYQQMRLEQYKNSAPADRYFGRLKLSYLGINNTFRDSAISAGDHTTDASIINKVNFADDALRDWSGKFPHDPQLARTYFLAIKIQKKIWLKENQERAWVYMNRISTTFGTTYFGKLIKKDLAIGFTEHYYANAQPCPTPPPTPEPTATPTPSPTPAPRGRRGPAPTPEPPSTPTPPATPESTPTPIPRPDATTLAKGLKLQIEIPPCVPPATPAPATPVPSSPANPTASAVPSATAPTTMPSAVASPAPPSPTPRASPH